VSRRTVTSAENDAFSRWGRKYLIYINRAGVRSKIKRQARRRERREGRREARSRQNEDLSNVFPKSRLTGENGEHRAP
jgi:hypothetical protein